MQFTSGRVVLCGGESLPQAGANSLGVDTNGEDLTTVLVPSGRYAVEAYAISWDLSPRWWSEEERRPDDAPADLVLKLSPASPASPAFTSEPRLREDVPWVFTDEPREIGPTPGMLLITTVRKGPAGLTLKECGPGHYTATLADYSPVQWKDRIRIRVTAVDHDGHHLVGEFVAKLSS